MDILNCYFSYILICHFLYIVSSRLHNAAFECKSAGGECGFAYKIDEWDEEFGMDGKLEPMEGNTITILKSNGKTFDFVSEYLVCKVIVKAGRGAIIYSFPEGTYADQGLLGF